MTESPNPGFFDLDEPDDVGPLWNVRVAPVPFKTDGVLLSAMKDSLADQGQRINETLFHQLDDVRFIEGLEAYCAASGERVEDYFYHSNRFATLDRFAGLFDRNQPVVIPESDDNRYHTGSLRREEEGHKMDFDHLAAAGIDPKYVLYFRVTQPTDGTPKPEYYWTSDLHETKAGLDYELGMRAHTAIILVSTLAEIAQPDGVMDDINDDQGIAVRQISLTPFDQSRAMFTMRRHDVEQSQ